MIAREYTDNLFLISLILALYNGMLFFSSIIFGRLGDMYGRKKVIMWGFLVSTIVLFSHNFIHNIQTTFLMRGLAGLSIGMIPGGKKRNLCSVVSISIDKKKFRGLSSIFHKA
ncbi:MAG: MFS transporter [bacterium]